MMTVQNGLGAEETVHRHGEWPLISAVTFMSGTKHSDTHVEYILDTPTWLGPYGATPYERVEELAQLLGGAVGASLAAVDAGWAAPDRQVGLTGKVVSPDVYFALGISGASQHLAGIGGAKAVVAVNTDPDAPIFARARLGVVMDCRTFVAAMIDRLRSAQ